jgi:biotin carboxyl carrier protein
MSGVGDQLTVVPIGDGIYRVSDANGSSVVAVAGPPDNRWVWVDGRVARLDPPAAAGRSRRGSAAHDLASPMPATVIRVLVEPGAKVARGDTLLMLEAMKMELPVRAPRDGMVRAVSCRVGELVQPGVNLLELE